MKKSTFISPAYQVTRIPVDDIVSQRANPNQMTAKSFSALQQSIFNGGYVGPVQVANNLEYDPSTDGQPKPSLVEHVDTNDGVIANNEGGVQVADDRIASFFKWRLIDGSHRTQVVRLGQYYFENGYDDSDNWADGRNIPDKPGPKMLAYLAWREDFTIPCVVMDLDSTMQMSMEILMNTARGAHGLESLKDIVYNLINVAGMSEEWVSQNLFLDMESIKRMQQLSGLKASFSGGENGSIDDASMAWSPEKDDSYGRKLAAYLTREATKFIDKYRMENRDNPDALAKIPTSGTALDQAIACGFDQEDAMVRHGEEYQHLIEGKQG